MILLIRHGRSRGPKTRLRALRPGYLDPFLSDVARRAPALRRRIRLWHTGEPPPDLGGVRAILFLLSDPLAELYPQCHAEASRVAAAARERGIRLVNPPDALSRSVKSTQARLWLDAGLPTPPHHHFANRAALLALLGTTAFPALIRPDRLHAQQSMRYCASAQDAARLPDEALIYPGTITPFIDTRAGYRETEPATPWADYFHKKRAFVFGSIVRCNHVFFSKSPIVGAKTSTFGHGRSLDPVRRLRERRRCAPHVRLDYAYWQRRSEHEELLRKASRSLGLEFVAIDYSSLADGSIMLWEANPHFSLHLWPLQLLKRRRRLKERQASHHDDMMAFLEELLEKTR